MLSAGFQQRQHFMSIGNFRHLPNSDSLQWLAAGGLWRQIRHALGQRGVTAELHIYGAYPPSPAASAQLHAPEDGLFFKGHAPSLEVLPTHYRTLRDWSRCMLVLPQSIHAPVEPCSMLEE